MIPPYVALSAYILIGAILMADRDSARGFSIAFLAGYMLLPESTMIRLPGILPNLDKTTAITYGVLFGTLVFHTDRLLRLRFRWADVLVVLMLIGIVITSVVNALSLYDGLSTALNEILTWTLPVFLARIHLSTPKGFRTFLLALVWASIIYLPLVMWEFRMSPQIHRLVYGFFQHEFYQFVRGGFYRPVVFFYHALDLARFYALCAFLAAFPLRRDLARMTSIGNFVFCGPLLGLLLSMSFGPYFLFAALCTVYVLGMRFRYLVYAIPVAGFIYLGFVLAGYQPLSGLVRTVASIDTERARSFQYRLDALDEYRDNIVQRPLFGFGGWARGRIQGRATDSEFLIRALRFGLIMGAGLLFGWWFWVSQVGLRLAQATRGTPFGRLIFGAALMPPLAIAMSTVDSALDHHVLMLASSILGVDLTLRQSGILNRLKRRRRRMPHGTPQYPRRPRASRA